ncbi:DUF2292 domain-containing protein [candidate division WWE3 bacterium]|jgi:hypothetical protein|uniref:DUF2292 domain-containing protein n=1 Tax=candidate division WWE3 bacterium TaxID=2053526 RepID=A0A3A4ZFY0_UNCKA|nr:MAG: DUF2292 domain-containing protein [candidate division WWE3 bacterium]
MEKPVFTLDEVKALKILGLFDSEISLISYIRTLKWGSVEITVQNSEPVFAKSAYQTIKFASGQGRVSSEHG